MKCDMTWSGVKIKVAAARLPSAYLCFYKVTFCDLDKYGFEGKDTVHYHLKFLYPKMQRKKKKKILGQY